MADFHRSDRITLRVLAVIALLLAGTALVSGVVGVVTTLAGTGSLALVADAPAALGRISEITVSTADVSSGPRAFLAISVALAAVTQATVAATSAFFLWNLGGARPFTTALFRTVLVTGMVLLFGGLLGDGARGTAQLRAAFELEGSLGDVVEPAVLFAPTNWLVGFVVIGAAFAIKFGSRLRRDTEGLI